jgi:integrating conjugative element protein (TIGR03757 family)|tara:strand:+ start:3376 stop:3783 length:408 start_codon:yes stop_codon:yes gene_type:complete
MRRVLPSLFLLLYLVPAHGFEVTVFTAEDLPPLRGLEQATVVYTLGNTRAPLAQLTLPNPGNAEQAKRAALDRLNSPAGRAALEAVRDKATATAMAQLLQIERLPAVLVSPGYVVYGVYDVAEALRKVEAYRARP